MKSTEPNHRVLITGASGNLARKLIDEIQQTGLKGQAGELLLTDLQAPADLPSSPMITFQKLDLGEPTGLRQLVKNYQPHFILHFGSLLSGACEQNLERAWAINGTASLVLLEAAADLPGCVFFFPSTGATYGAGVPDPLPDDYPQWPANFYGVAKVAIERAGVYLHKKRGLDFRCLRFPMVLSPSAPAAAVSAYASRAFVEAKAGRPFIFPVSPDTGISTIYIKDVITGIRRFIDAPRERLTRRIYNLHSFGPTAEEIAAAIKRRVPGFEAVYRPDPFVDGLMRGWPRAHLDAPAREDWGWAPRFDLETTAADMIPA